MGATSAAVAHPNADGTFEPRVDEAALVVE
jgi:hypothetical protein